MLRPYRTFREMPPLIHPELVNARTILRIIMLSWLWELRSTQSVASAVLILSLVAASGLALGSVPLGGISLGIGGVLFAGLAFGYLGFQVDPHILHFVK